MVSLCHGVLKDRTTRILLGFLSCRDRSSEDTEKNCGVPDAALDSRAVTLSIALVPTRPTRLER